MPGRVWGCRNAQSSHNGKLDFGLQHLLPGGGDRRELVKGIEYKFQPRSNKLETGWKLNDELVATQVGIFLDDLKNHLVDIGEKKVKILACGPNPMLRAMQQFTIENNIDCEVSMESAMACGFGICQGCPIEYKEDENYKLICKDGPIFNIRDIKI